MNETIFVLTVLYLGATGSIKRHRTWGWFPTLALAEESVMANHGDMYEAGYYDTAVVEEVPWGPLAIVSAEHWYSATAGEDDQYDVKKIDKPAALQNLVGFGMG